jgi:hypothetical protein
MAQLFLAVLQFALVAGSHSIQFFWRIADAFGRVPVVEFRFGFIEASSVKPIARSGIQSCRAVSIP